MSVRKICEAVVRDEKSILPVSVLMNGEYGISDVVLSFPCIVGAGGCETKIPIALSREESSLLQESAKTLKEILRSE